MKEFPDTHWYSLEACNAEGMFVWRLEVNQHGSMMLPLYGGCDGLYEEDVYVIIQNNKLDDGRLDHHVHIWVGACASELDLRHAERQAAAMDLRLRRRAPLHWERQSRECEQFHSYFKPVMYLRGKYQDYIKECIPSTDVLEMEKSLFSVYVVRNMRKVKQVECDISSLNKHDPLILITETDIVYVLVRGSWSPEVLRSIGETVSFRMTLKNLNFRQMDVVMLDKSAAIKDWDDFYKALGWEDTDSFLPIPDGIEEKVQSSKPLLYEILRNRRGHIYYRNIPFPVKKDALDSKSLYILANGKDDVCLWIGKKNQDRNKAKLYGLAKLQEFTSQQIPLSKWPPWQHLTIIPEGLEPPFFKEYFHNWIGQD